MIFNHNYTHNKRIFFDSGNQRLYVTGGWNTFAQTNEHFPNGTYDASANVTNSISLKGTHTPVLVGNLLTAEWCSGVAYTGKKIDVTSINKINFKVSQVVTPGNGRRYEVGLTKGGLNTILGEDKKEALVYEEVSSAGTVTIDVSSLSGEYIIYAIAGFNDSGGSSNASASMAVKTIWAE